MKQNQIADVCARLVQAVEALWLTASARNPAQVCGLAKPALAHSLYLVKYTHA